MSRKTKTTSSADITADTTSLPRSRSEARDAGARYYETGKPCKRGHVSTRWASDGRCIECNRNRDKRRAGSPWRWAQQARHRCAVRAREVGLPCDIEAEDLHGLLLDQEFRCPVFGVKLKLKGRAGTMRGASASVDRLDPDKGYVKGNVAVLSVRANRIKSAYNSTEIMAVGVWLQKQGL